MPPPQGAEHCGSRQSCQLGRQHQALGSFYAFIAPLPGLVWKAGFFFFFYLPLLLEFVQGLFPFCHVLQMRVPSQLGRGADGTDQAY